MLVGAGANVNATDNMGYTPLHMNGHVEVSQMLVGAGADVGATGILVGRIDGLQNRNKRDIPWKHRSLSEHSERRCGV